MLLTNFIVICDGGKSRLFFQITRLFFCYLCGFKSEWLIELSSEWLTIHLINHSQIN